MPDIAWHSANEEILMLREIEILECVDCTKFNPPQQEGSEDIFPIRHKMMRRELRHLKSIVVVLFLVPNLRVGVAAAQLDELNVISLIIVKYYS